MSPVKIQRVSTAPYSLPLKSSLHWGKDHRLQALDHVLVRVELSDGSAGVAEATPRPTIYGETPESVGAIIARDCSELLLGHEIRSLEDVSGAEQKLAAIKNNNTAKGALNMALFAAAAQSLEQPISTLLGARQPRIRVSYILGTGETDEVLREVEGVYAAGVRFLKVKVGKNIDSEIELIRTVRQHYPRIDLYVDANECLDPANAEALLYRLADAQVRYCEEPLPVRLLHERQRLRLRSRVPLIADDSCFSRDDLERELEFDTFDILNIKTARTGYSQSGRMLLRALEQGKGVMIGSQASSLLGCLFALLFSAQAGIAHPTEGTFFLKVLDERFEGLHIDNGYVDTVEVEAKLMVMQQHLAR